MKLKLKNPSAPTTDATPQEAAAPPAPVPVKAGGLKLKFKPAVPTDPTATDGADNQGNSAPKPKRKYTKKPKVDENGHPLAQGKLGPKKRAREDGEDIDAPKPKRKPKPTAKSMEMIDQSEDDEDFDAQDEPAPRPRAPPQRMPSIKLSIKPKTTGPGSLQRAGTAILKVKGAGKPPVRPYGVGYDSEAEEAEPDPAIESQFVLRMVPGEDCDLLRKSIEEKTIGKSMAQGGPGVYFRFFDREGRRAMVTIQGRSYAASMVELPTIVESLKSWNKKDWVKTADVCQMLLVLGRVSNEDEARKYARPTYVEPDSHRYPHGLTPPMQWARKRRFRPRKSYLDVERAEAHMNRLLQADEAAESSKFELIDSDADVDPLSGEDDENEEDDEDEGDDEDDEMMEDQTEEAVEGMEADDLEEMFKQGFEEDETVEVQVDSNTMEGLFVGDVSGLGGATPATAHDVALHALQQNGTIALETETAASTPAAATSADDDDDDDDDDADSDEDGDGEDDAVEAEEQRKDQLRSELAELDKAIEALVEARNKATNKIFKSRKQNEIEKMQADRDIKRRQLGEDMDE